MLEIEAKCLHDNLSCWLVYVSIPILILHQVCENSEAFLKKSYKKTYSCVSKFDVEHKNRTNTGVIHK